MHIVYVRDSIRQKHKAIGGRQKKCLEESISEKRLIWNQPDICGPAGDWWGLQKKRKKRKKKKEEDSSSTMDRKKH